nr:flavodoxin domain-containing protein [uncultured Desulfobulbus sp.]
MAKALIVYGSETGNTKTAAQTICTLFQQQGIEVSLFDARTVKATNLGQGFDLTVFGSSSRGNLDTIEFPPSFAPLYDQLNKAHIRSRNIAVFGCGDSKRPYFCGAVELLLEKIGDLGGKLVHKPLRIDGDPAEAEPEILSWSKDVAHSVHQ